MQACFRGWRVRQGQTRKKSLASSLRIARHGADESYLEATIMLVDDLLKDLIPRPSEWREHSSTDIFSGPDVASSSQCNPHARAGCTTSLHRQLQNLGLDVGWDMHGLGTSKSYEGLKSLSSSNHVGIELQGLDKDAFLEAAEDQSGEVCTSDSASVDKGHDIQKVSKTFINKASIF